jgi:hypothetical protein
VGSFKKILSADTDARDKGKSRPQLSPKPELVGTSIPNDKLAGSFLFNMINAKASLRSNHPSPKLIGMLWDYYVRNVDLLVKVFYRPTVEALVMSACSDLKGIDTSTEALLFGIDFATVKTMSAEECSKLHGEKRRRAA